MQLWRLRLRRQLNVTFEGHFGAAGAAPGHNWCTAAPCTMAWFIGIAMHLHLGASQLPGTVLHRAPRCIRPLRHPHRGACQPYCTECAPAPRCIPALLNVSLTLGLHCNSTKKLARSSTEIDTAFLPFLHLHAPRCTVHRGASPPVCTCTLVHHGGWRTGLHLAPSASHVRSTRIEMLRRQIAPGCMVLHQL